MQRRIFILTSSCSLLLLNHSTPSFPPTSPTTPYLSSLLKYSTVIRRPSQPGTKPFLDAQTPENYKKRQFFVVKIKRYEETLLYIRGNNCSWTVKKWNVTSCKEIHLNNMKNSYRDQTGSNQHGEARLFYTDTFLWSFVKSGNIKIVVALWANMLKCCCSVTENYHFISSQRNRLDRISCVEMELISKHFGDYSFLLHQSCMWRVTKLHSVFIHWKGEDLTFRGAKLFTIWRLSLFCLFLK